jgi:uncharacterized membrane protein
MRQANIHILFTVGIIILNGITVSNTFALNAPSVRGTIHPAVRCKQYLHSNNSNNNNCCQLSLLQSSHNQLQNRHQRNNMYNVNKSNINRYSSTTGKNCRRPSLLIQKVSLPNLFETEDSAPTDAVLKEFAIKEAAIQKRRQDAQAKLDEYDATIEKIQSRKAEYMAASQLADAPVGGSFSETTLRSAVKAFVWRLIAGSVTFVTTLQFSGSLKQAVQVVGADFFSKSFTMFIGERLMNKSQAGRKKGGDNAKRSLVKALVWRLFAICNTLTMAIFISKDLSIASKIASTDALFKTALMFFYERVWARIGWGKEYLIEFSI